MKRLLFYGVLFCACSVAWAQDEEMTSGLEPPLGQVVPLIEKNESIIVASPILLNLAAVVPENSVARTVFIMPERGDADVREASKHKGVNKDAFMRMQWEPAPSELTPLQRAAQERALGVVWKDLSHFRAALERFVNLTSRFVYQEPGSNDVKMELFDFPQGMFLGQQSGKVRVLALQKAGLAYSVGMRAGADILSINGQALNGTLKDFVEKYSAAYDKEKSASRRIDIAYLQKGEEKEKIFTISLPRSLDQDFWGHSDGLKSSTQKSTNSSTTNNPPPAPVSTNQ